MITKKNIKIESILLSLCLVFFSFNSFAWTTITSGEKFGGALTVSDLEDCHGVTNHLFSPNFFDKASTHRTCPRKPLVDLGEAGVEAVTTIIGGAVGAGAVWPPLRRVLWESLYILEAFIGPSLNLLPRHWNVMTQGNPGILVF